MGKKIMNTVLFLVVHWRMCCHDAADRGMVHQAR